MHDLQACIEVNNIAAARFGGRRKIVIAPRACFAAREGNNHLTSPLLILVQAHR